jgi:nitrogenase molybdenum-cofactor synthesis protein NifE
MTQLSYQIPDNGRKKTILRIPESHALYLCPMACGRRQGIRALKNGEAGHASFLTFTQADIALGDYIGMMHDAVAQVLDEVRPTPRVLMLYVNCIDDFVGTDGDALVEELSAEHPGVKFLLSHINPVANDMRESMAGSLHSSYFEALEPVDEDARDTGVNFVGGFVGLPQDCEMRAFLQAAGVCEVRSLVESPDFDSYSRMAASQLDIAVTSLAQGTCQGLEERLGIPWMYWPACYDVGEIAARYEALLERLGLCRKDEAAQTCSRMLEEARTEALAATQEALDVIGDTPLVVDTSASMMPFSLALALLKAGFNVVSVFSLHSKGNDEEARARLEREHPDICVVTKQGIEAMEGLGLPRECISLGRDAAFLLRAEHTPDMYHDEGFFGYQGVTRLMRQLIACLGRTERWDA